MTTESRARAPGRLPWIVGVSAFLAIAAFFLLTEHRAHVLGALPYILILSCPVIHFLMHGRHGHGRRAGAAHEHAEDEHEGPIGSGRWPRSRSRRARPWSRWGAAPA